MHLKRKVIAKIKRIKDVKLLRLILRFIEGLTKE